MICNLLSVVEQATGVAEATGASAGSNIGETFLQIAPDLLNFGAGVFGKDRTPAPAQVSRGALSNFNTNVNVSPQLLSARRAYQAIIRNPNATPNQKLAAQTILAQQESQIFSDKLNRENQLQANKASLENSINRQQAILDEQARQDKMASEANLGIGGNFARTALGNIGTKLLKSKAQSNLANQSSEDVANYIQTLPPSERRRMLQIMNQ